MPEQIGSSSTAPAPFNYELYEGDPDHLRTVDARPPLPGSYIDPASLKLKYRIGHGLFGDVWLATHHRSASDYDEYHEIAIKSLHPMKEDNVNAFLSKFEELWMNLKSRRVEGVCWLHGIAVMSNEICIALKYYEGSIGDRMAQLKGGKVPLPDVLRYGIDLNKGIQELHKMGVLVLNLKPNNFLLDEQDHAVLGDFGLAHLLLGIPSPDSDFEIRLGTPNYMAPEQWQPGVQGPISYETDSWGFACSIIEMLTGIPPWFGKSVEEIHRTVVLRKEKPTVPHGLPPAVDEVLRGCFEYDILNRPSLEDILRAFESSKNSVYADGSWSGTGSSLLVDRPHCSGYTRWFNSKHPLQIGDTVRSRKSSNTCKPVSLAISEGTVVDVEKDSDRDGFVLVQVPHRQNPLKVNALTLERVISGFSAGNWASLINKNEKHSSLGILHSIQRDGSVAVGFLGLETLWRGHCSEIKVVEPFLVGQFVRLKATVVAPRYEWPHKRGGAWASGKILHIFPNGCLEIGFPGMFVFGDESNRCLANPEELECVSFETCDGFVEKFEHVEDIHWAVRPLAITVGLLTALKVGISVGKGVGGKLSKRKRAQKQKGISKEERQRSGNSAWLPPTVANILFKDGLPISNSA